jgi:hypothetical protein
MKICFKFAKVIFNRHKYCLIELIIVIIYKDKVIYGKEYLTHVNINRIYVKEK